MASWRHGVMASWRHGVAQRRFIQLWTPNASGGDATMAMASVARNPLEQRMRGIGSIASVMGAEKPADSKMAASSSGI